ncbi:MAG TPA: hypothetical protein VLJ76_05035 [Gaiellaceae bacterium]|nr:hypothetical protein [Gaiellaceae bacterium]
MPRSPDAERDLADARTALENDAIPFAIERAWSSAVAAARIGDETTLAALVEVTTAIADQAAPAQHKEADQLNRYVALCLQDARNGTRPHSAFERLLGWTRPQR